MCVHGVGRGRMMSYRGVVHVHCVEGGRCWGLKYMYVCAYVSISYM